MEAKIAQLGERMTEDHKVRCSIHLLGVFLQSTNNHFSLFMQDAIYVKKRATDAQQNTKEEHEPGFQLLLQEPFFSPGCSIKNSNPSFLT